MSSKNMNGNKKSYKLSIIIGIVVPIFLVFLGFYWPKIHELWWADIDLIVEIQPSSIILMDGSCLNINAKAQVTNKSSKNLRVSKYNCFTKRTDFWSLLPFVDQKDKQLGVLNVLPLNEDAKLSLIPSSAYGAYDLFINVPLPNHIQEVKQIWIKENYDLTYQELLDNLDLTVLDLIITVQTNPVFEDETVLHLFKK